MAKYIWDMSVPTGDWSTDKIAFYQAIDNVKLMEDYINKSRLKREWFAQSNIGRDHATLIVESTEYSVRLFFMFTDTGFVYADRKYTNGSTYNNKTIESWNYSKYNLDNRGENPFDVSYEKIVYILENFFKKFNESKKSARKSMKERFDGYSKEDLLELGYDIDKIAKNFNPTVNKVEGSGDYFSLYLVDKKSKIGLWVDCSFDDEGYVTWDWNNYIFTTTNPKEMLIKYLQEEENTCWVCDCVIEDWCHENEKYRESKKSTRKSMKEYRTVGLEQEVREKCIEILEDSHEDLFDLGVCDGIITYDNKGRTYTTSYGDVWIDYITLPLYFWSSGYTPSNKDTQKIVDGIIDYNMECARERLWDEHEDELVQLGITDKDDDKLNYHDLYDLDKSDLAEELSEYEMDSEGTELYTQVSCEIIDVDNGVELTVEMTVTDEYGHRLVKSYKPSKPILIREGDDVEEIVRDTIKSVTEKF